MILTPLVCGNLRDRRGRMRMEIVTCSAHRFGRRLPGGRHALLSLCQAAGSRLMQARLSHSNWPAAAGPTHPIARFNYGFGRSKDDPDGAK